MNTSYNIEKPAWFRDEQVVQELDARAMLAAGEHPVNQVMADLKALPQGNIYKLIAPFLPAPLIDKASSMEVRHWMVKEQDDLYVIYFCKP